MSTGFNQLKTHTSLWLDYDCFSKHAEMDAIIKSRYNCDTILVVRINKRGKLSCSRPCEKCIKFATDNGVKRIYFSDWDGEIKYLKLQ